MVVTGRGHGCNPASCMAGLAVLKRELHVVAQLVPTWHKLHNPQKQQLATQ